MHTCIQDTAHTKGYTRDKSDALREGLRLLWSREGQAALSALDILKPDKAAELRDLMAEAEQEEMDR